MNIKIVVTGAILAGFSAVGYGAPNNPEKLLEQKSKLQYTMAKLRVKLIQEDSELRELNERIIKLQKLMMKKLNGHKEMRYLTSQMDKLNQQLKQ